MASLTTYSTPNNPGDPLLRILQSLDDNDPALLRSALTVDCTLDQSGLSVLTGFPMPTITGHDAVEKALLTYGVGATLDTGHLVGNLRVMPSRSDEGGGDGVADVTCYVVGSHYRKGEGLDVSKKGFMAGTKWTAEVVSEDADWKIRKAGIKVLWAEGDMSMMKGEH